MATYIPNQPIYFGTESECTTDELSIPQIVNDADVQQFQFLVAPCEDAEQVMPDSTFDSAENYILDEGWSISYNTLCLSGENAAGETAQTGESGYLYSPFVAEGYYQVTVSVQSISIGGSLGVYIGTQLIGTITATGNYTFYGFANLPLSGDYPLQIISLSDDTTACLTEIEAYEILTNFILAVYNADGSFQTSVAYEDEPLLFTFSEDTVTVEVNWNQLGIDQYGCHYLCFLDPCVNSNGQNYPATVLNPGMDSDGMGGTTDWSFAPICWTAQPNSVIGTSTGFDDSLGQLDVFPILTNEYTIEVVVSAGTGIGLSVFFGANQVGYITSIGTHRIAGLPDTNGNLNLYLDSGVGVVVTNVTPITPDGSTDKPYACNFRSNDFRVGDFQDDCSLLITACNNGNGLGFNFNQSGFAPSLRIPAKLRQAQYPAERTIQEDSVGDKGTNYFTGRKAKLLCVDLQHEYIHDFLQLLRGFDNFYIGTEKYFVEDDEYPVEYPNESDNIGKVKLLVSTRKQNVKNTNCSDTGSNCNFVKVSKSDS